MEVSTSNIPAEENFTATTTAVRNNGTNLNNAVKYIYKTAAKNKNATDKLAMLAFLPFTNRKKLLEEISNSRQQTEFVIDNPYKQLKKEVEEEEQEEEKYNVEEEKNEKEEEQNGVEIEEVVEGKTSNLTKFLLNASNNQNFLYNHNNKSAKNNTTLIETTTQTITQKTRTTTTCTTLTTINSNELEHDVTAATAASTPTSVTASTTSSATASAASSLSSTYSLNSSAATTTKSESSDNLLNVGLDYVDAVSTTTTITTATAKQIKTKNSQQQQQQHVATLSTLAKNVAVKRKHQQQQQQINYKQQQQQINITQQQQHGGGGGGGVVSIKHSNRIPSDILDDLASRFVINVPDIELTNLIRVCFQIELAHWFYLDFFCSSISKHQQNQQNRSERKKQQQLQQQQQEEDDKLKLTDTKIEKSNVLEVITTTTPNKHTKTTTTIFDYFNNEDDAQKLQPCGIKYFALQLFEHIPFLRKHSASVEKILDDWKNYKLSVPTFGAILISEDLNYCLLVQSYFAKSSWGFPKGKVNENEDPVHCATREVYEETGYDISNIIDPNDYIESVINYQYTRLYLVHNVSLNTQFAPRTRYEIRCCDWFPIDSLPVNKSDAISKSKLGIKTNSFFMIMPFVKRLKRWVHDKRELIETTGGGVGVGGVQIQHNTETMTAIATATTAATTSATTTTLATVPKLKTISLLSTLQDPFAIPSPIVSCATTTPLATTTRNNNHNNQQLMNNRRRYYSPINQQQQQQQQQKDTYTPSALLLSSGKLLKIAHHNDNNETAAATTGKKQQQQQQQRYIKTKDSNKYVNSIKHSNSAAKLPQQIENLHKRERHKSMGDLELLNVATTATPTTIQSNVL